MNIKKIALGVAYVGMMALPLLASAQFSNLPDTPTPTVVDFCSIINLLLQITWVVFTAIAVISFVVAGILFVTSQGSADKVAAARGAVLWGVVGIVVGILAYVIISIVASALGAGGNITC